MPDENTNPVGVTQTSQNDQATTNPTGDDFSLDFGGVEDTKEMTPEGVETQDFNLGEMNNENESGSSESEINLGFDEDTHEGDNQENNINIQDLDSLLNEKQDSGFDISLDSTNENKQDNLEEQESGEGENDIIMSDDENKIETDQEMEAQKENDTEELDISPDDTKQEDIEKEQNNELQENDNPENDNSIHLEEENTKNNGENEEVNDEVHDFDDIEGNTQNDNPSELVETNEVQDNQENEENASDKNIGNLEEKPAQGDDFSISFDDNTDLSDDSDNKLNEEFIEKDVNGDIDNGNQNVGTENDEKAELGDEESLNMEVENTTDEEILDKNEDTQETNPEIAENEGIKTDISSNQEEPIESKIEEKFKAEVNTPEVGTENEDINIPTETTNNGEANDELSAESSVNDEKSDNKDETLEQTKTTNENLENHDSKPEDLIMNFNLEEDTDSQPTKQPEIGDLLGNFSVDTETPTDEDKEKDDEYEKHDTAVDTPVTDNIDDANEIAPNQDISQNDVVENNSEGGDIEKQDFTLDYVDDENNKQEELQNKHTDDNVDNANDVQTESASQSSQTSEGETASTYNLDDMEMPVNNGSQEHITESNSVDSEKQDLSQTQVDQVNNASESITSESVEKNPNNEIKEMPGIATLSLDQILDSELNSNPQYADNSKAVPKNVPLNSGFFNKKTVGIIVMTLILGGFVAVLAFPSKKTERKEGDIVQYTGYQMIEEDHYVGDDPIEGRDEYTGTETGIGEEIDDILDDTLNTEKTVDIKHGNPKVAEFPDRDPGEDDIADSTVGEYDEEDFPQSNPTQSEPIPYTCTDEDCEEEPQEEEIIITTGDIEQTISNYKSEAEKYYEYGDSIQDKKLVKYSLQIINLCDTYQGHIENGEQNTQEDFEEFKSKIVSLKSKIEKYIGGGEEVETFVQSNFKDEYDFEGKDELLDFINGEDL